METTTRTAVFIVDDMPTMRERLREFVADIEGVEVVGDAGTAADAVTAILHMQPDCVLLDYQLNGGTALDVLRGVHPQSPDIVFVVLTNHATPQHRRACIDAGARFFFDKSAEFGEVRSAIANSTQRLR
jgi:DNA-binding NarL/FixJ family response regulator